MGDLRKSMLAYAAASAQILASINIGFAAWKGGAVEQMRLISSSGR
jgi:hypothetical protein